MNLEKRDFGEDYGTYFKKMGRNTTNSQRRT